MAATLNPQQPVNPQQPATMQDIYDVEQRMQLSIGGLAKKTDLDDLKTAIAIEGLAMKTAIEGLATNIENLRKSLEPKDAPFAGNACAT